MPAKRADFSEFSYGYALTSELVDRYNLRQLGYPLFPSLTEEGKKGGGFDVKLPGVPLFLQFKVPEVLVGPRAGEAALLGLPYYRMKLRRLTYSAQHNLLLALEASGNDVYYATPQFHLPADLNDSFLAGVVENDTWFFRPTDIGKLDNAEHYIAYRPGDTSGYLRSPGDPRLVRRVPGESVFRLRLPERVRAPRRHPNLNSLIMNMLSIHSDFAVEAHRRLTQTQILNSNLSAESVALYIAQTLFDCHLLIFPEVA